MKKYATTVFMLLFIAAQSITQNSQLSTLYSEGNFGKCVKQCALLLIDDPENLQANFYQGMSLVSLSKYPEAEPFLIKAKKLGFQPQTGININLLIIYARMNREDELILGDETLGETFKTYDYELTEAVAIAYYGNGLVAAAQNEYDRGFAYTFGFSWKDVILRSQINRDFEAQRLGVQRIRTYSRCF